MNMTPLQRIERATVSLIRDKDYMWLAGIIVMGNTTVSKDENLTACTDGINTEYGEAFISKLTDRQLMGLVLHESMHKAFMHMQTWRHLYDDDPVLANMACDYVINLPIRDRERHDGFVALPPDGCVDEKYRGLDAGQVFALLKQDKQNGKSTGSGKGFDQHDWENGKGMTKAEVEGLKSAVEQALRQGNILASKAGGNVDRAIVDMLEPKVDWRTVLREFITNTKRGDDYLSYRRVDRRFMSQNVNAPTAYSDTTHRIVLGVDTSGSIGGRELAAFLAEAQGVCTSIKPDMVDIIYWGHIVAAHETYEAHMLDSMVSSTKPKGGGGTAPSCLSQYLNEQGIKPDCIVMLTDGEVGGDWGNDWPAPVLWCINNNRYTAPTGVTVRM